MVELLPDEPLEVERHRPERWWQTPMVAGICCSCCCCCCCCAHTVGAVAGAVAGSIGALAKAANDREARRGAFMASVAYWVGFGLVSLAAIFVSFLLEETLIALIALVFLAPGLQFFGSVFALPTILLQPSSAGRRAAAGAIGTTTLGWLAGGLVGGLIMAVGIAGLVLAFGAAS